MATGEAFRPSGQHELGPSGQVSRVNANLAAIRTLRVLQEEGRPAAPGEQAILARWSGWGAVPGVFDEAKDRFADARAELRSLLTEDEYAAARRTTINAHYTSAEIVRTMWDAVAGLGFDGGAVLEPGCGSGNFMGFAPPSARMLGVELDPVTAGIAAALYPDAEIRNESFADSRLPDGGFDLVIGNVPFSKANLHDPRHNPAGHQMHNHFIIKGLHLTRPGGLVAVITSYYTLDRISSSHREEMAGLADLVTAIRLPSESHRKAAGTDAIMDLLILRRREEGRPPANADWMRAIQTELDGEIVPVNEYFKNRPGNVLGDLAVGDGLYRANELNVRHRGDMTQLPAELADLLATVSADANATGLAMSPAEPWRKMADIRPGGGRVALRIAARDASRFEGTITAHGDGTFTVLRDGDAEAWPCPDSQAPELRALLRLRDTVCSLLSAEKASPDDTPQVTTLRARLNREYDAYTATHGPLNRASWRRTGRTDEAGNETFSRQAPAQGGFRQDPYAATVYALEDFDPEAGTASKAAIFTHRVIADRSPATSADTPEDAVAICMDADGEVRIERAASLLGSASREEARTALGELVYDEPDTGKLVPAAEYLSGKVRAKLAVAAKAAEADPRYQANAEALRRVLPAELGPGDIDARLGASWIPPAYIQQGLRAILQDRTLTVNKGYGTTWRVKGNTNSIEARTVYGTEDKDALTLAQCLLEQRPIKVSYSMDDLDPADRERLKNAHSRDDMNAFIRARAAAATVTARAKADELSERFTEWLWEEPKRTSELTRIYNDKFNSLVLRSYDDARPRLPGLTAAFKPHPHQYAAVARIISEPAALLAHEVGAGKTAEMVMGAMELRRLGLVTKPAIIVPNHMLEQFQREFLQLYPQARVLAAGKKDLEKNRRHALVARVATGDWDAVIMTRSVFERIPMSADEQERYINARLAAYDQWLERAAAEKADTRMVKRMETQKVSFEERLKRKLVRTRDAGITWEQTGIDYLFIDEAHGHKNLDTRSNNPGLDIDGSGRASDLDMKLGYLRRGGNRRVVTFATATPIANSMTEAYVMTKYLRPDLLTDAGIDDFDGWAGSFTATSTDVEVAPEGGLRVKERVASFRNVPELLLMWRVFADVKTAEDLKLPVPDLIGGKPEVVTVDPSEGLRQFMLSLAGRADEVRTGKVDPKEDNMLKISSDGRAAALDMRLVGRRAQEDAKLDIAAARIATIYLDNKDNTYADRDGNEERARGGLQIVFCELGTPTGKSKFGVYEYLKAELSARGVPAGQVRFMHEARNDKEKADLFAAARAGKVSVLIGTTELMGVGTNVQKRAVALHHLDCPWRPADVAQREGRILRQGNHNPQVRVIRYVTEGSFDAYMWQTVLRKAKFIAQVMHGTLDSREMEDIGGSDALSYSEVTALANGDMRIFAKAQADADVQRLSRLESSWRRGKQHLKTRISDGKRSIPYLQERVASLETLIARRAEMKGDAFHCELNGRHFTKRSDAAAELQSTLQMDNGSSAHSIGHFGGFDLEILGSHRNGAAATLTLKDIPYGWVKVLPEDSLLGVITKLENNLKSLDGDLADERQVIKDTEAEIRRAQEALTTPFAKAAELARARSEADRLAAELGGQRVLPEAGIEAHETPVTDAAAEREDEGDDGVGVSAQNPAWESSGPAATTDENPLDTVPRPSAEPGEWDDELDESANPSPEPAGAAQAREEPSAEPVRQPNEPARELAAESSSPDVPADAMPPAGTEPVESHRAWGGTLRPERLLYADGTPLTVRRTGAFGDVMVNATAAGSKATAANGSYGGGHVQVVRYEDGSYGTPHPARVYPCDTDPYIGLSDEDRARWEIFDRSETNEGAVAYLPANLIRVGDMLQVERGTRKRPADMRAVWGVSNPAYADGAINLTLPGMKSGLRVPAGHFMGVAIPEDHPTLSAAISAITGTKEERSQPTPDKPQSKAEVQAETTRTPGPPVAAAAGGQRPTPEQQAIIDGCVAGQDLVIEAGAGTGKTSTLRMASTAMTGRSGLYVAYNRAIANEASGSFPANVACSTAHSLAFRAIGRNYAHRLPPKSKRLPADEIASLLGLLEPLRLGDDVTLSPAQLAGTVMATVGRFCQSADHGISAFHLPRVNGVADEDRKQLVELLLPLAVRAWTDLQRPDGRLPFQHDHYLKMWQLTRPGLNTDFVLFDEAQDANPVIAAIIQGQRNTQRIAVGDSCQAIYGWRGAVDALATWPADQRLYLSQSFRFGQQIADEANKWLENLDAVLRLKGTPAIPSTIGAVESPDAILCRTNAEAVSQALTMLERDRRVALVGGGDDIKRLAEAAQQLQERGFTNHPELAAFTTWNAVQRYVRDDESGADLATFVRLVDKHGPCTVISTINQLSSEDNADVTVTTAHKAKGREWGQVLIASDFREPKVNEQTGEPGVIPRPDAMLAYVSVTRAKKRLDRKGLEWIDNYAGETAAAEPRSTQEPERAQVTLVSAEPAQASPEPAETAEADEKPTPAAIRIEHDDEGTRIYGTDRSQSDVKRVLKSHGFKWSRNQGYWYLNRSWKFHTRSDRVRGVRAALDALGVAHETATAPEQAPESPPAQEPTGAEPITQATTPDPSVQAVAPEPSPATKEQPEPASAFEQESLFRASVPEAPKQGDEVAGSPEPAGIPAPPPAEATGPLESLLQVPVNPQPYEGGRAQAESGSMIIENDFRAWQHVHQQAGDAQLPDEHPRVAQITRAWRAIWAKGLTDGPGPAGVRYHTLAHAALSLAASTAPVSGEIDALNLLATHARKHSVRLRATAEHLFSESGKSGRYANGRTDAERGSRVVEKDYRAWARTGVPAEAARDPELWRHARRAELAWHAIRRAGLADGPAPAAARYQELANATRDLADGFTANLPSHALSHLLELAEHAEKHSTRLGATARPGSTAALPEQVATITQHAHATQRPPPAPQHENADDQAARRNGTMQRQLASRGDQRQLPRTQLSVMRPDRPG